MPFRIKAIVSKPRVHIVISASRDHATSAHRLTQDLELCPSILLRRWLRFISDVSTAQHKIYAQLFNFVKRNQSSYWVNFTRIFWRIRADIGDFTTLRRTVVDVDITKQRKLDWRHN